MLSAKPSCGIAHGHRLARAATCLDGCEQVRKSLREVYQLSNKNRGFAKDAAKANFWPGFITLGSAAHQVPCVSPCPMGCSGRVRPSCTQLRVAACHFASGSWFIHMPFVRSNISETEPTKYPNAFPKLSCSWPRAHNPNSYCEDL